MPASYDGLRVLDLSESVAGNLASKLMWLNGADVALVEPPGGSALRAPRDGRPSHPRDYRFDHLNAGKASIELALDDAADRARLEDVLPTVDVVIVDDGRDGAWMPDLDVHPHLVVLTVREFPAVDAYAGMVGSEMIHQALSGTMFVTGREGQPPIYGLGDRAYYAAGTTAYSTVSAALIERDRSGRGQRCDVSVLEAAAAMGQNLVSQYSYNGSFAQRSRYPGMLSMLRCRESWVVLFALRNWPAICEVFGLEDLIDDPRFARSPERVRNWHLASAAIAERARDLDADELVERAQLRKISIEKVHTIDDLLESPHLRARGFLTSDADGRRLAPPFREFGQRQSRGGAIAEVGQGGAAFIERGTPRWLGSTSDELPEHSAPPLDGVRVLDLTSAWAGPMATRSLAFLGATVIKIESAASMDSWRGALTGGAPQRYPDLDAGAEPYNRDCYFNTQNHDKLSTAVNLKAPGALDAVLDLCRQVDVVIANFSSGALARLGLGYERVREVRPDIVVVEMPAFGEGGPMTHHVGMGKTMEAAAGMASLMGYGDGEPVLTGPAYLDPVGGLHGAAATLTALLRHRRFGEGTHVEVAQTEGAMNWIGEYLLAALDGVTAPPPDTNRVPHAAPHGAYPCQGDDAWVALAVFDDAGWRALCAAMGSPDLAGDPRFSTLDARKHNEDALDALVAGWTATGDKHEIAERLRGTGVAAAPVCSGADIHDSPGLRAAGFVVRLGNEAAGEHEYPGLAYRLERTPGALRRHAPRYGEHNDQVFGGLLGRTPDELSQLRAVGALVDAPPPGSGR